LDFWIFGFLDFFGVLCSLILFLKGKKIEKAVSEIPSEQKLDQMPYSGNGSAFIVIALNFESIFLTTILHIQHLK